MSAREPFRFSGQQFSTAHTLERPASAMAFPIQNQEPQPKSALSKTLNLSGLRRKNSGSQNSKSIGGFIRSHRLSPPPVDGTTANTRNHKIASPRPIKPSAFLSVSTVPFKLPDTPAGQRPPPALGSTHIPFGEQTITNAAPATNDVYFVPSPSRTHIMEGNDFHLDGDRSLAEQALNQSLHIIEEPFGENGPRRLTPIMPAPQQENMDGIRRLRRSKRSLTPSHGLLQEINEEEDLGRTIKRSKDESAAIHEHEFLQQQQQHLPQSQQRQRSVSHHPSQQSAASDHQRSQNQNRPASVLGLDLESYIAANKEHYLEMGRKWSQCTFEEWKEGEHEITAKFSAILEFVKDYIVTKVSNLAQIQSSISEHKNVLSTRGKILEEVENSLIKDGGAVIGRMGVENGNSV